MRLCPYFRVPHPPVNHVTAHFSATSIHQSPQIPIKMSWPRRSTVGKQGASSPPTLIMHNRRAGNMNISMVLVREDGKRRQQQNKMRS
jgi:hypothetical protein